MVKKTLSARVKALAVAAASVASIATGLVVAPQTQQFTAEASGSTNYARLVQYSLYFFDANMCGNISGKCGLSWRGNCHTYDSSISTSKGTLDLSGGFHDAGDHVKFNLPAAFSFATLGYARNQFPTAYTSTGQEAHLKVIQTHFAEYFKKCTKLNSSGGADWYCYQVGEGGADHKYWGAPEAQSASQGHNETFFVEPGGAGRDQAAAAAAGLALNYINYKDETDLTYAKALYNLAKGANGAATAGASGFYGMNAANADGYLQLAAVTLKVATNSSAYDDVATPKYYGWLHNWSTPSAIINAMKGDWAQLNSGQANPSKTDYDGYHYYGQPWGSARYNCGVQFAGLVYDKNQGGTSNASDAKTQMDMILGNNKWNNGQSVSLVVGWASNSAKAVHHRAADGTTSGPGNGFVNVPSGGGQATTSGSPNTRANVHPMPGALAGGPLPFTDGFKHYDAVNDYVGNEVAMDYNANFAAAAAGLYHFFGGGSKAIDTSINGVSKIYPADGGTDPGTGTTTTQNININTTTTTNSVVNPGGDWVTVADGAFDKGMDKNSFEFCPYGMFPPTATVQSIEFKMNTNVSKFDGGYGFSTREGSPLHTSEYWYGNYDKAIFTVSGDTVKLTLDAKESVSISSATAEAKFQLGNWYSEPSGLKVTAIKITYTDSTPTITTQATTTTLATTTTTQATTTTTATPISTATTTTTSFNPGNGVAGDANGDGKVTIADVVAVRTYLLSPTKYPLTQEQIANVLKIFTTGGIQIQPSHAVAIQDFVVEKIKSFPITP